MRTKVFYKFIDVLNLAGFDSYEDYVDDQFDDPKFDKNIVKELVSRFNYRSWIESIYFEVDNEEFTPEPGHTLFTPRLNLFTNIIYETYDEYAKLIELQQDKMDDLIKSAKSVSLTRVNDTPQNTGDFIDDEHTSNITKNEAYVELDVLSALEQAKEFVKDIYDSWLKRLAGFIIYE